MTVSRKSKAESKTKPASKAKAKAVPKSKAPAKKQSASKYISVKVALNHPFQKIVIPTGPPGVMLDRDDWLDSQIGAGLIKEL